MVETTTSTAAFVHYVVLTDRGYWGRGSTLQEALDKADALNQKGKIRRGVKVIAKKNIQTEKDILDESRIKALESDRFFSVTGYSVGEYLMPWVDDWGSIHYFGRLESIEGLEF
jgi:hypothetical protein